MKVKSKIIIMVTTVLMTTILVTLGMKKESKAFYVFRDRPISFDYCEFELEGDEFQWTGEEICPNVKVSYNGEVLERNGNYRLLYKNNIDAGTAEVKVKPVFGGNFLGNKTFYFKIKGVNIKDTWKAQFKNIEEATGKILNDEIVVYNGDEIVDPSNYVIDKFVASKLLDSGRVLDTYELTTQYIVSGKGKFDGFVTCEKKGKYKEVSPNVYFKIIEFVFKNMDEWKDFEVDSEDLIEETSAAPVEVLPEDAIIIDESSIEEYKEKLEDLGVIIE